MGNATYTFKMISQRGHIRSKLTITFHSNYLPCFSRFFPVFILVFSFKKVIWGPFINDFFLHLFSVISLFLISLLGFNSIMFLPPLTNTPQYV